MILLSAHKDTVFTPYEFEYKNGNFIGLLDNAVGMMVIEGMFLEDVNLVKLEKQGDLSVFFGSGEEWGVYDDLPKLKKEDIVLVVDMETGKHYDKYDCAFVNVSGFSNKEVKEINEHLKWEGFNVLIKLYDANPDNEDEAWEWRKRGHKVISIVIPCNEVEGTGWHIDNNSISIERLIKCKQIIKRLINILL